MNHEQGELFDNYDDINKRHKNIIYGDEDTYLPDAIMDKQRYPINNINISRVCLTPLRQIISRGQQIRTYNRLVVIAHRMGFVVNKPYLANYVANEIGYTGGCVLEPKPGYRKRPVTTLDFEGLYPSIMISFLLCYSTIVLIDAFKHVLPRDCYNIIRIANDRGGFNEHWFIKVVPCVMATNLDEMKVERKAVKKEMALMKGTPMEAILNGLQNALKVCMNSAYGFTGVPNGIFPCLPIAETVTFIGREFIQDTKNNVETQFAHYNVEVIYGDTDSVMVLHRALDGDDDGILEAMRRGSEMANWITDWYHKKGLLGVRLTNEEVKCPSFFLHIKKAHLCMSYTDESQVVQYRNHPKLGPQINCKGMPDKKRGYPKFFKDCYDNVKKKITLDKDPEGAVETVKTFVNAIVNNTLPFEDYIATKSLKDKYDNLVPHGEANNRQRERDKGSEYGTGDRVPHVFVEAKGDLNSKSSRPKKHTKCEVASFVKGKKLKLDRAHYIDLLTKSMCTFLIPIAENPKDIFDKAIQLVHNQRSGNNSITTLFDAKRKRDAEQSSSDEPLTKKLKTDDSVGVQEKRKRESEDELSALQSDEIPDQKRIAVNIDDKPVKMTTEPKTQSLDVNIRMRDLTKAYVPIKKASKKQLPPKNLEQMNKMWGKFLEKK